MDSIVIIPLANRYAVIVPIVIWNAAEITASRPRCIINCLPFKYPDATVIGKLTIIITAIGIANKIGVLIALNTYGATRRKIPISIINNLNSID